MAEGNTNSDPMEDIQGPPTSGSSTLPPLPPFIPEDQEVRQSLPSLSTKRSQTSLISKSSTSMFASSSNKFTLAADRNHILLNRCKENDGFLESIRRKDAPYPHLDLNQEFSDLLKAVENISNDPDSSGPQVPERYCLMKAKYDIFHHVRRFERLREYEELRKEVEYRPAIDDLVALAFCHRSNSQHAFGCETELFLPAEPFTATADIAAFLYLPKEWAVALTELNREHKHAFFALTGESHLLTFAVEARGPGRPSATNTSGHQLAFYLCSAQNQRRALGFTNHTIYGLSSVGHTATLFVSSWVQNTVVIAPTRHQFDLSSFSQHMELFVVLCQLAEKFEEQFEEMKMQRNDSSILKKNEDAAARPWRLPSKPTKPGKKAGRNTPREVSDGMASDSESDSDLLEENLFRDSFELSKSFVTSENNSNNQSQVPLKAEILEQYIPAETTMRPDIATWAQHITNE